MELYEDGHVEMLEIQLFRSADGGHITGKRLAIHPVASVHYLFLAFFVDNLLLMGGTSTLKRCDTYACLPVETSQTEGHAQFDIGGVGAFAINLVVIAIEHRIGLQRTVFAAVSEVGLQLMGTFWTIAKIEIAVSDVDISRPIVSHTDVETKQAVTEGNINVLYAVIFLEWGAA